MFAAAALQVFLKRELQRHEPDYRLTQEEAYEVAGAAYEVADAMMDGT